MCFSSSSIRRKFSNFISFLHNGEIYFDIAIRQLYGTKVIDDSIFTSVDSKKKVFHQKLSGSIEGFHSPNSLIALNDLVKSLVL